MIAGDAASRQDEPYERLAIGPWARADVRQTLGPAPDLADEARAIAGRWTAAVEVAKSDGRALFPGPLLGLSRFAASGGVLALVLHPTDYRAFVGTNLAPEHVAGGRPRSDALGLSLVVVAAGPAGPRVLLHRRGSACFEHPLAVDTPGGHAEPARHLAPDGSPCVFAAARDELRSELGLDDGDLDGELSLLGLTRIRATAKPQLVFLARTRLGPDAVRTRIAGASEGYETAELLPCDGRALAALLAAARSGGERVTPAGLAAIALALELRALDA